MKYDRITRGSLDYCFYRYGRSKTLFRGPRPDLARPHCIFFGGNETFGKFVEYPFTRLLQRQLDMPCANFAALNAGVEMVLADPSLLLATGSAKVSVVAISGAHNLSNRFYSVHPRHNDRFIKPSKMLTNLFRDVEFTDIHYTKHLLTTLAEADAIRFGIVIDELKTAWLSRMRTFLERIEGRIVLLWMSNTPPDEAGREPTVTDLSREPLFIDQSMMDALSPLATKVVECVASKAARKAGMDGMMFSTGERGAASQMPGPAFHVEVAEKLSGVLRGMV